MEPVSLFFVTLMLMSLGKLQLSFSGAQCYISRRENLSQSAMARRPSVVTEAQMPKSMLMDSAGRRTVAG